MKNIKQLLLDAIASKNLIIKHDKSCALFLMTPKKQICDCWVKTFEEVIKQ